MDKYFYVDTDGRQCGPVEEDKLISNGVTSSTKIWKRGMKGYVHAGKLLPHIFITEPAKPRCDVKPSPRDERNKDVKYYYIDTAGNQKGPVKEEELIAKGVTKTTKIWRNGLPKYMDAGIILPRLFQSYGGSSKTKTVGGSKTGSVTGSASSQPKTTGGSKTGNVTGSTSSQTKTVGGSKTGKITGSASSQTKTVGGSKTGNVTGSASSETKSIGGSKTKRRESSSDWKTYAIIQLIATFVIFLPLAIFFEIKVNELLFEHNSEIIGYTNNPGRAGAITKMAYFGAKIWPLVAIGIAGIASLISIFMKNEYDQREYTLSSLGICVGTVVLGIVSFFFPLAMFFIILVAIILGMLYNTFKSN